MMENKLVQRFMHQVEELFSVQKDREAMFEVLKQYQLSSDVKRLVLDLKRLVNDPEKLEIYDHIRPLIRPQHQQNYDKMAPQLPGQRLRVIRLRRRLNESFGFAVRGGYEHGIGVFVSHVQPGSQADHRGLKMGDEIVRVNGFTIAEAIHEEVLNLIKGRDEIELKVTNIGMVPIKQNPTDPVTWQYVDKTGPSKQQAESQSSNLETRKIFINLRGAPSLGCSIISGPKQYPGIYVETVRPGSLGEDYGLAVGDQILEVNGKSFQEIKHKEAIVELKGSKELNMVIKKGAGLALLNLKNKSPKGSPVAMRKGPDHESPARDRKNSEEMICEMLENLSDRQALDDSQEILDQERERERQLEEDRRTLEREEKLRRQQEEEQRLRELDRRRAEQQKLEFERKKEQQRLEKEAEIERQREEEKARQEEVRRDQLKRSRDIARKKQQEEEEEQQRNAEALAQKREDKRLGYHYTESRHYKDQHIRTILFDQELEQETLLYNDEIQALRETLKFTRLAKERNAVLAGRLGPQRSMKPTLLGAGTGSATLLGAGKDSETSSSNDKLIKEVTIWKEDSLPLDMNIEGGIGTPLGDKIVVSDVLPGGAVAQDGEIQQGDQLLEINGKSLSGMQLSKAEQLLWEAEQNCPSGGCLKFLISESEFKANQDEITYF